MLGEHDVRAGGREPDGDGAADALRCAGDDRDAILQSEARIVDGHAILHTLIKCHTCARSASPSARIPIEPVPPSTSAQRLGDVVDIITRCGYVLRCESIEHNR